MTPAETQRAIQRLVSQAQASTARAMCHLKAANRHLADQEKNMRSWASSGKNPIKSESYNRDYVNSIYASARADHQGWSGARDEHAPLQASHLRRVRWPPPRVRAQDVRRGPPEGILLLVQARHGRRHGGHRLSRPDALRGVASDSRRRARLPRVRERNVPRALPGWMAEGAHGGPTMKRRFVKAPEDALRFLESDIEQHTGPGCYCDMPVEGETGIIECTNCVHRRWLSAVRSMLRPVAAAIRAPRKLSE